MNGFSSSSTQHPFMLRGGVTGDKRTQSGKVKEVARELEADEDEGRWEERLRKVAKQRADKPE
jgi:hypothetical protein